MRHIRHAVLATVLLAVLGCSSPTERKDAPNVESNAHASVGAPALRLFRPVDDKAAVFWVRFTTETERLLQEMVADFNQGRQGLPIKADYIGGYSEIFKKVSAGIQAKTLPAIAVAYESMAAEYIQAGAVVPLDSYINDPSTGIPPSELADFIPAAIETNRYPKFGNAMYSFPFSKSVLVMYFSRRALNEAGIQEPAKTWDEFLEHCRQVKSKTGKYGCAINIDCSTIDGFIFSMGGEIVSGRETLYDSRQAIKVFQLIETLAKEDLAFQVPPGTYDDDSAIAQDRIAYSFRTSSGKTSIALLKQGDKESWGMTVIPQADPANPRTVLYGPNICIFSTTPEQQQAAWEFVRHFTSRKTTVAWAIGSGYLPVRKSAHEDPDMQRYWADWKYNRIPYDCMAFARVEPNFAGWQEVRSLVEKAETTVLTKVKPGEAAARELKKAADAVLARW